MQEELELQDAQLEAVAAFVRARATAAPPATGIDEKVGQNGLKDENGGDARTPRLPSDMRCDPMRSRLALYVAGRSAGAGGGGGGRGGGGVPALADDSVAAATLLLPLEVERGSAQAAAEVRRLFAGLGAAGGGAEPGEDAAAVKEDAAAIKEERMTQPTVA